MDDVGDVGVNFIGNGVGLGIEVELIAVQVEQLELGQPGMIWWGKRRTNC